jgi:hypothetical protein
MFLAHGRDSVRRRNDCREVLMSSVDSDWRSCALFALCLLAGREPLSPLVPSGALHILENTFRCT